MRRGLFLLLAALAVALTGCKDLKSQQLPAYVGDTQTKMFYKNVGEFTKIVPKERRVYFRSTEEGQKQGYTLQNELPDPTGDAPADDSGA